MKRKQPLYKRVIYTIILGVQGTGLYRHVATRLRPRYTIVEASDADMHAVLAWLNPGETPPPLAVRSGVHDYVAKTGAKVIGAGHLVRYEQQAGAFTGYWLFSLQVRLSWRGRGVGEALCRRIMAQAKQEGAGQLSLLVVAQNSAAVRLYRKLGFERKNDPAVDEVLRANDVRPGRRTIAMSVQL
jgi:GNAT superfamily N-acetyltransferase